MYVYVCVFVCFPLSPIVAHVALLNRPRTPDSSDDEAELERKPMQRQLSVEEEKQVLHKHTQTHISSLLLLLLSLHF